MDICHKPRFKLWSTAAITVHRPNFTYDEITTDYTISFVLKIKKRWVNTSTPTLENPEREREREREKS